ncbi:MAG: FAD:protein FMN transferase [Candidatus Krumholzibacteria bacterium]|nr:FAD:protein FMN transferase [Candidatus Krumholzibacteria bacterium]
MMNLLALPLLLMATAAAPYHEGMRPVMGTFARVQIAGEGDGIRLAADAALDEIERLDRVLSHYKPESDLSRLNATGGEAAVVVVRDLYRVLERSLHFYRISDGAFDVTVAPLVRLWKKRAQPPQGEELQQVRDAVGSDLVRLDGDRHTVRYNGRDVEIELGAIGKGYAVDCAVEVLRTHHVSSAVIDLGRTLYCMGSPVTGDGWPVGIAHPLDPEAVAGVVRLINKAVSTSGNYESPHTVAGKRVGHIIDPRTGHPVANQVLSVTVVCDDATSADALSTAVFVLGVERGMRLIDRVPGVEGIIFYRAKDNGYGHRASNGFDAEWVDDQFAR